MTDSDVRTFRAATIHEALRMIEDDLGREAVILHTRQIEQRSWLPWQTAREEYEVTAGIGWTVANTANTANTATRRVTRPNTATATVAHGRTRPRPRHVTRPTRHNTANTALSHGPACDFFSQGIFRRLENL